MKPLLINDMTTIAKIFSNGKVVTRALLAELGTFYSTTQVGCFRLIMVSVLD